MAGTIKDIARELHLSVSTVSYALNNGPKPVSDDVRRRVLAVAHDMGYMPNRVARSLVTRRTHTIGIVPTNPDRDLALIPFFQHLFNSLLNEAELLEQDILVFARSNHSDPSQLVRIVMDGRVDGLVFIAPPSNSGVFELLIGHRIPSVVLSSEVSGFPVFRCDNRQGVDLAVRHLAELGHNRIAHIAGRQNMVDGIERKAAFIHSMGKLGLAIPEGYILDGDFLIASGEQLGHQLLSQSRPPTAIFCGNDDIAIGAIEAAEQRGLRVPEDVSIVGFDAVRHYRRSNITSVKQPLDEMAAQAFRSLFTMITEGTECESRLFQTDLLQLSTTTSPKEDFHQ